MLSCHLVKWDSLNFCSSLLIIASDSVTVTWLESRNVLQREGVDLCAGIRGEGMGAEEREIGGGKEIRRGEERERK